MSGRHTVFTVCTIRTIVNGCGLSAVLVGDGNGGHLARLADSHRGGKTISTGRTIITLDAVTFITFITF